MHDKLKTSKEWKKELKNDGAIIEILDHDGWNRTNMDDFEYSFNEETISIEEFVIRLMASTIRCDWVCLNKLVTEKQKEVNEVELFLKDFKGEK